MTPQFLREEAIRFRGMAVTVDREASKLRLLTMANDYEFSGKGSRRIDRAESGRGDQGQYRQKDRQGTERGRLEMAQCSRTDWPSRLRAQP